MAIAAGYGSAIRHREPILQVNELSLRRSWLRQPWVRPIHRRRAKTPGPAWLQGSFFLTGARTSGRPTVGSWWTRGSCLRELVDEIGDWVRGVAAESPAPAAPPTARICTIRPAWPSRGSLSLAGSRLCCVSGASRQRSHRPSTSRRRWPGR